MWIAFLSRPPVPFRYAGTVVTTSQRTTPIRWVRESWDHRYFVPVSGFFNLPPPTIFAARRHARMQAEDRERERESPKATASDRKQLPEDWRGRPKMDGRRKARKNGGFDVAFSCANEKLGNVRRIMNEALFLQVFKWSFSCLLGLAYLSFLI